MARREDKTIPVQPSRLAWIVAEGSPEEDGTNLGTAKRQPKVAGLAGGDRVDGQSAGIACSNRKNFAR